MAETVIILALLMRVAVACSPAVRSTSVAKHSTRGPQEKMIYKRIKDFALDEPTGYMFVASR